VESGRSLVMEGYNGIIAGLNFKYQLRVEPSFDDQELLNPFQLVFLTEDESELWGGKCLDGTVYGFQYRPATTIDHARKWVLFLEGGGFCMKTNEHRVNGQTCEERTQTAQGSSRHFEVKELKHGMLSNSSHINPDFNCWNHAYLPYCSGDLYTGMDRRKYLGYYAAGHLNVFSVIQKLKKDYDLTSADEVIIGGSSAGAYGALIHLNFFAEALPNTKVSGFINSGWMFPMEHFNAYEKKITEDKSYSYFHSYFNNSILPDHVTKLLFSTRGDIEELFTPFEGKLEVEQTPYLHLLLPHITPPLFSASHEFDSNQLVWFDGMPTSNNSLIRNYLEDYYNLENHLLQSTIRASPDTGVLIVSCFEHVVDWKKVVVNNKSLQEIFGEWYYRKGDSTNGKYLTKNECEVPGFPCNSNCKKNLDV